MRASQRDRSSEWTVERRRATSEHLRRLWASGRFADRRKGKHPRRWSGLEDAALVELAGSMPLGDLAAAISARFGLERTPDAVRIRAKRLDVSLWTKALGLGDLERIFRLDHRAIVRCWLEPGILTAHRWQGRGPNPGWWIEPAEVERFIRECGWAYDWERLPVGRWRSLAEVAHKADPWVHYVQVAAYVGIASNNLDRWRRRGLVPHRIRPKSGPGGYVMVRAKDLPGIKAAIQTAQAEARARALAKFKERARRGPRDERGRLLKAEAAA